MNKKILQVFYGADALPYKDKERSVHFPIVGSAIQNANNTTQIKFYFGRLLEEGEQATFVAVSKLPNGKIGSKILEAYEDEELGEQYALLDLDSFYTQYKGDVFISLQGYEGGVRVEEDENGIYQIYGTPTIAVTGSIKLAVNYAPSFVGSGETENITLQQVLGVLSTKLGIRQETLYVEELPTVGNTNVWYVINNDQNDTNKANIYIWNATTQSYVWVGDNTLDLGDYYTKEEGQDFEEEVRQTIGNGSPKGVYATLEDLQTAYPTGTTGIYVVSADGHWYYWNGSAWADGGLYLSTQNYTDIENTLDKVLIETETSSLGAGGLVASLKVKAGQTIRIKITGPGANVWLRETSGGSDLEELGYVNANTTKDFVATYDGNYLRFYCEGASTIKCDILETYIPTLFDRVDDIESDISDLQGNVSNLQSDVTTLNSLKAENLKVKQEYSFNNGTQVFTDFDDAPANTRVYLAQGVSNYTNAPIDYVGMSNDSYVETYRIGTQNYVQYVREVRTDGTSLLATRSAYTDNGNLIWSNWKYIDEGNDNCIKINQEFSFNDGVRVFTDFNDAPINTRVYLASGITNYDNAPENLFGASNSSYVETYKIGNNIEQYVWMARVDGSGVLCHRSMYVDNSQQVWSDWDYNDYGNEPIVVSTATDLYNKIIWLNNNNKKNATVILTPNTTYDFSNGISGQYNDIPLGNNITIQGAPNAVIYCNYQGDDTNVNQLYSIFKKMSNGGNFTLKGVVIKSYNIRYCVHDEDSANPDNYFNKYINCDFYLNQNGKTDDERAYYLQCIGGGLGRNGNILIMGCKFQSVFDDFVADSSHPDIPEVSYHNCAGNADDNYRSQVVIMNNYFTHTCAVSCYGSQTAKSTAIICGNRVSVKPYLYWQSGDAAENFELLEWNNKVSSQADFTEIDYTPTIITAYGTLTKNYTYIVDKTIYLIFKYTATTNIPAWTQIGSIQAPYDGTDFYFDALSSNNSGAIRKMYLAPTGSIYNVDAISSGETLEVRTFFRIG